MGTFSSQWLTAEDLGLQEDLNVDWNNYIVGLKHASIILVEVDDTLVWYWNSDGQVNAKSIYDAISNSSSDFGEKWRYRKTWKGNLPLKLKFFMWLCMENR